MTRHVAAVIGDVLGAGLERDHHHVVLRAVGEHDALAAELPADRARLGHRPTELGEHVAHVRAGAVAVVGQRLDQQTDTARRVGLVGDRLVRPAAGLAGARA